MTQGEVRVRPVEAADQEAWRTLFAGYRQFYEVPDDDDVLDRVWGWLLDDDHEVHGLVAEVDGVVAGLAHHRLFSRPSRGAGGLYLDDLFTSADVRGRGVGRALLARLAEIAREQGCDRVRWITAEDNHTARRLYDDVARRTSWVTYDLEV